MFFMVYLPGMLPVCEVEAADDNGQQQARTAQDGFKHHCLFHKAVVVMKSRPAGLRLCLFSLGHDTGLDESYAEQCDQKSNAA